MCVTHVYRCLECDRCEAVPLLGSFESFWSPQSLRDRWQKWTGGSGGGGGGGKKEDRVAEDLLCDNRFCQRRSEGGYRVCLSLDYPCFFCIRFGKTEWCRNQKVTKICDDCRDTCSPVTLSFESKERPRFRRRKEREEEEGEKEAARVLSLHSQGLAVASADRLLANQAVLAGTHK